MLDQIEQVTGKWWGLSREEPWYNNARGRSGHRVIGHGPGSRRKVNVMKRIGRGSVLIQEACRMNGLPDPQ